MASAMFFFCLPLTRQKTLHIPLYTKMDTKESGDQQWNGVDGMRLQQRTKRPVKYSELESVRLNGKVAVQRAEDAVELLLVQGYALVSSKNINAVTKVIKALREMNMEFTLRTFRSIHEKTVEDYEFTLPHFEDDRGQKEGLPLVAQMAVPDVISAKIAKGN